VAGYSGDAGDAMAGAARPLWTANGMMFSAEDVDNDIGVNIQCGTMGGWWHGACSTSTLNRNTDGRWWTGDPVVIDVRFSRMLVKFNN